MSESCKMYTFKKALLGGTLADQWHCFFVTSSSAIVTAPVRPQITWRPLQHSKSICIHLISDQGEMFICPITQSSTTSHSMTLGTDKIVYTFSQSSNGASSVGRNANVKQIDID